MAKTTVSELPDQSQKNTFEQVWAVIMELSEQRKAEMKKWDREWELREKEWELRKKDWERQEKDWERQEKDWEMREKELEKKSKQLEEDREKREQRERELEAFKEEMKENTRKYNEMSNRFGEMAEYLVAPGIADKFNDLGFHFDAVSPGGHILKDENGRVVTEIDILLTNFDCIIAVEVKTRPRKHDIEHHTKRLEILREYRDKKNDHRKIFGAIAGVVYGSKEKEETVSAGFYVIEQTGDTMRIYMPQGFSPKEF